MNPQHVRLQNAEAACLAGLIDREGLLLAAGVLKQICSDRLELLSRCRSLEQMALVRLGRLYIDPRSGVELQHDKFSASKKRGENESGILLASTHFADRLAWLWQNHLAQTAGV